MISYQATRFYKSIKNLELEFIKKWETRLIMYLVFLKTISLLMLYNEKGRISDLNHLLDDWIWSPKSNSLFGRPNRLLLLDLGDLGRAAPNPM